jgi:hypothetical protein
MLNKLKSSFLIINSADILREWERNHSDRNTIIGSTLVARRAGA